MSKGKRLTAFLGGAALIAVMLPGTAAAQSVQDLQAQIDELNMKLEKLLQEKSEEPEKSADDLKVEAKGAPRFSGLGFKNFKLRGRVQTDFGHVSEGDRLGDPGLGTTTEFRRAQLGVEGEISDFKYKFEADFADGDVNVTDAYVQWKADPVSLLIGNHKTHVSLEEQTSSRFTTFMERAAFTDAFDFTREAGVTASTGGDEWTFDLGIYSDGGFSGDDEAAGILLAGRGTVSPKAGEAQLHLGGSFQLRTEGAAPARYRQRPQIHTTDTRFINADLRDQGVDKDINFGLEGAGILGPLHVAGEWSYLKSNLTMPVAAGLDGKAGFSGWYVEGGWFLTGESRGYKGGTFDRTKVKNPVGNGGLGAFQIATRWDQVELNDSGAGVFGGKQRAILVGMTWIPMDYVRFLANYSNVKITGGPVNPAPGSSFTADVLGLRAQVDW